MLWMILKEFVWYKRSDNKNAPLMLHIYFSNESFFFDIQVFSAEFNILVVETPN